MDVSKLIEKAREAAERRNYDYAIDLFLQALKLSPDECLPAQSADLRCAAGTLREWYPDMRVETYVAMRSGSRLSFHGVTDETGPQRS